MSRVVIEMDEWKYTGGVLYFSVYGLEVHSQTIQTRNVHAYDTHNTGTYVRTYKMDNRCSRLCTFQLFNFFFYWKPLFLFLPFLSFFNFFPLIIFCFSFLPLFISSFLFLSSILYSFIYSFLHCHTKIKLYFEFILKYFHFP